MIHEYWNATVWSKLGEPRLLLNVLHDVDALVLIVFAVRGLQLLQDNGSLVTIGSTKGQDLKALVGDQSVRSRHILQRLGGRALLNSFRNYFHELARSLGEAVDGSFEHEDEEQHYEDTEDGPHANIAGRYLEFKVVP